MAKHIEYVTSAPATAPANIGMHLVDTANKVEYFSVGTGSAADWVARGGSSGGGGQSALYDASVSSYFEIDVNVDASPVFVFDVAKPFVRIKNVDNTGGMSVEFRLPDSSNPMNSGDLGMIEFNVMYENTLLASTAFSPSWTNQAGTGLTSMYGTAIDLMSARFNYFKIRPINGNAEWAISQVSSETYW